MPLNIEPPFTGISFSGGFDLIVLYLLRPTRRVVRKQVLFGRRDLSTGIMAPVHGRPMIWRAAANRC
jgi:hypothetical protein